MAVHGSHVVSGSWSMKGALALRILASLSAVLLALFSCSSGGGSSTPSAGSDGASCYPNGTCNAGLSCVGNVCVGTDGGGSGGGSGGGACAGQATYPTCAACEAAGCNCAGCSAQSGTQGGSCQGTPLTCAKCGSSYNCSSGYCPDCTSGTSSACTGVPTYSTCASCLPSPYSFPYYCQNPNYTQYCPGCTLSGSCVTLLNNIACSQLTSSFVPSDWTVSEACTALGCDLNGSPCSGTPTPCPDLPLDRCNLTGNICNFSGSTTCIGTVTPCSGQPSTACEAESGCSWGNSTTCTGTP